MNKAKVRFKIVHELVIYALWLIAGAVIGTFAIFLIAFLFFHTTKVPPEMMAVSFWPAIVTATYARMKKKGLSLRRIGLYFTPQSLALFVGGLLLGAFPIALVFFVLKPMNLITSVNHQITSTFLLSLGLGFVSTLIQSGTEEIVFRGYLLRVLTEKGRFFGILTTAVIFSALHIWQGMNLLGWFNIFLFGVFAAQLVFLAKSLWIPIGFHAAWNFAQMRIFGFPLYGHEEASGFLQIISQTPGIITGGSYGPEGSIIATAILLAVIGFLALKEQRQPHMALGDAT